MVTPADINRKQFTATRLREGYDQSEVDDFLDLVEAEYKKALENGETWRREAERLKRVVDSMSESPTSVLPLAPSGSAEKILLAAQRTADMVESEANSEAGKIRATARAEADGLKRSAEAERQNILNQLETERAELEEKIQTLKAKRSTYKSWLRTTLSKLEEEEAADV